MTMHLTHHTTTGRRRAKFKYASAEQKRQALELEQEWNSLKQRHATKTPTKSSGSIVRKYKLEIPAGRGTGHIPSRSSGVGTAIKNDIPVYTGTKMIGIGVLHKSNAVPVFSDEEAIDIAKMRRG